MVSTTKEDKSPFIAKCWRCNSVEAKLYKVTQQKIFLKQKVFVTLRRNDPLCDKCAKILKTNGYVLKVEE